MNGLSLGGDLIPFWTHTPIVKINWFVNHEETYCQTLKNGLYVCILFVNIVLDGVSFF
jgi:hypothetical protein